LPCGPSFSISSTSPFQLPAKIWSIPPIESVQTSSLHFFASFQVKIPWPRKVTLPSRVCS